MHGAETTFVDRTILSTPTISVGEFRCTRDHPRFEDSGPIREDCFVFPRTAVAIEHQHEPAFVANPNTVTFYNAGQRYRRLAISADGDRCEWFTVERATACEVLEDAGVDAASDGPFSWSRGPADADAFLEREEILDAVRRGGNALTLNLAGIEERVILLLDRTVRSAAAHTAAAASARYRGSTRDAIHHVEVLLSAHPLKPWSLSELGEHAGLSAFHLCRAFRALTGHTIHQYRQQLRLRAALHSVRSERASLIDIAFEYGFCSHSHFTSAFRREFGVSPSAIRGRRVQVF